jgi:hypothetical protein
MTFMQTAEAVQDWEDSPVVRIAMQACGWPGCDLADLLAAIIEVKDLESEVLGRLGVSFTELVERAALATATKSSTDSVQWATDCGIDIAMASRIFDDTQAPAPVAVTITELHSRGWGPTRISAAANCSPWLVYETLKRLDMTPNNESEQKRMRDDQVCSYRLAGVEKKEIARMMGIKVSTVQGIIQRRQVKVAS